MSKNMFTAALVALASIFSIEANEKNLEVEFTCGDIFALSDGSVWELEQKVSLEPRQDILVKGNFRKEWQKRLRSQKTLMNSYEMYSKKELDVPFTCKLIGISDLIEKKISSLSLPEYDTTILEVFTTDSDEELAHLIELSDGALFTSSSASKGDCNDWEESDNVFHVRFDLRNYFLLNVAKGSSCVSRKLGTVKEEKRESKISGISEWGMDLENLGRWSRLSEIPYFPWQVGEMVTVTYFERMHTIGKPGEVNHFHNKGKYAMVFNHAKNEIVVVKQDYRRMPLEVIHS